MGGDGGGPLDGEEGFGDGSDDEESEEPQPSAPTDPYAFAILGEGVSHAAGALGASVATVATEAALLRAREPVSDFF